ncbi:MAG TPA: gamma-glutamyltransferase [Chloroflexota bacterium]|nr:gamma-glutamyltransferase [Chloroflexota bacterium]
MTEPTSCVAFPGPHGGAHRPAVTGRNGVVASAHYLASLAGLRVLIEGGNAVDAAVATAATLNVVEPYMSGIGGGGYMLVYLARSGEHHALDFTGNTPAALEPSRVRSQEELRDSALGTLVPGNLGGWLAALERFGTMDRAALFKHAIAYAEEGFPASVRNADLIAANADRLLRWGDGAPYLLGRVPGAPWAGRGAGNGRRAPRHGELIVQPALARTFRLVVEGGAEVLYRGEVGRALVRAAQAAGGCLTMEDLARFAVDWRAPIEQRYRGRLVRTVPPPCAGIQYLIGFGLLEGFDLAGLGHNSAEHLHLFIEATKLAVADRIAYAAHPSPPLRGLLSSEYQTARRRLIDPERAAISGGERRSNRRAPGEVTAGAPENTTHFSVVDREGNAVSVTQSIGALFGCGVVAPEVGVALNNFGFWMDRDPASHNAVGPNRRSSRAMSPAHVLQDGRLLLAIGTPGGFGILQTTPQMISNVVDFGMNVQAAIEAPRIRCALPAGEDPVFFDPAGPPVEERGSYVRVEDRIGPEVRAALARRGHVVDLLGPWSIAVGGGQGVRVDPETGALSGGADPRRDGYAVAF